MVKSLNEYINEITSIDVSSTTFENNILLFRGQSDCDYELLPSIGRGRKCAAEVSILNEERNLIEMAKFKMPEIFSKDLAPVELLALLQHHGIPTRLLDITENALVALYFACCSNNNKDGEVFVFKYDERYVANYPVINGLAESYKYSVGTFEFIDQFYNHIIDQPYFLEQKYMNEVCNKTPEEGAKWIVACCNNPLIIYAPIRSSRQQAQAGRYILFHNKIDYNEEMKKYSFLKIIEPISKDDKLIVKSIKISKENKRRILEQLKLVGISEDTMFPDSIDKVCKGIVEKCKKRL